MGALLVPTVLSASGATAHSSPSMLAMPRMFLPYATDEKIRIQNRTLRPSFGIGLTRKKWRLQTIPDANHFGSGGGVAGEFI
jgi:hypothetical protein